ncbi:hypothetical protein H6501_02370 [Candidatus Woesearchaeota archaeon]|nr:hypothetical protein [Candidatus Woesearchaeota archaeon]USN44935.1 MAG: hypothetical protein H6500_03810 [Candidatus Woesearchaeota archaeon]
MEIWMISLLGSKLITLLPAVALILIGFLAEKHYTGRLTLFANAVALISFFYVYTGLPTLLVLYINVLTLVGVLSLVSYMFQFSLPKEFYQIAGIFSSIVSGFILMWGLTL